VLTVVKSAKFCELTEGRLAAHAQTGLYSLGCTSKALLKWVLYSSDKALSLGFESVIYERSIFKQITTKYY
jgi:hypothetical protein